MTYLLAKGSLATEVIRVYISVDFCFAYVWDSELTRLPEKTFLKILLRYLQAMKCS